MRVSTRARRYIGFSVLVLAVISLLVTSAAQEIAAYFQSLTGTAESSSGSSPAQVSPFVQRLLVGGLLLLFGFLVYDRWKELREDVREFRSSSDKALREVSKSVEQRLKEQIDDKIRKVEALQSSAASLLDDYPWLVGLRESDFIPNIRSARLVCTVTGRFIESGRISIAYEYLYSWLEGQGSLQGSLEDVLQLVHLIDDKLDDPHLANMFLSQRARRSPDGLRIVPDLLTRVVREGDLSSAVSLARRLRSVVSPKPWSRAFWDAKLRIFRGNRGFVLACHSALANFSAASGDDRTASLHASKGRALATELCRMPEWEWSEIEKDVFGGQFGRARERMAQRLMSEALPRHLEHLPQLLGLESEVPEEVETEERLDKASSDNDDRVVDGNEEITPDRVAQGENQVLQPYRTNERDAVADAQSRSTEEGPVK